MTGPATYIALLRGINVGGKNKLPMHELADLFARAGGESVQTYIQSGNVIYKAGPELAQRIPDLVAEGIAERFGYRVPVITRSLEEFGGVVSSNPFLLNGDEPSGLHVAFLADCPDDDRVARLDPDRSPPDVFRISGRQIFLRCPNGLARTKFTNAYFDSVLATTTTIRNWRTVLALLAMTQG